MATEKVTFLALLAKVKNLGFCPTVPMSITLLRLDFNLGVWGAASWWYAPTAAPAASPPPPADNKVNKAENKMGKRAIREKYLLV